jgi:galactokinase/mevalonate kinase-like predicted kinase
MMFMVNPTQRVQVIEALQALPGKVVPFQFTEKGAVAWKL